MGSCIIMVNNDKNINVQEGIIPNNNITMAELFKVVKER